MNAEKLFPAVGARQARSFSWLGFLAFTIVALRLFTYQPPGGYQFQPTDYLARVLLLAAVLVLLLSDPVFFRRFPAYTYLYFPLQWLLIQVLGMLPPYQDIWGLLFIVFLVQGFTYLPIGWAFGLCGFVSLSYLATLSFNLGPSTGLALGFLILAGIAIVTSYEVVYKQVEAGRKESQRLLAEQQEALARLEDYAGRVQELSGAMERNRLIHKLQDSVNQVVFSISLTAQSIRILYDKNPDQVETKLGSLQELTSSALAQMRSLIQQWRPPA